MSATLDVRNVSKSFGGLLASRSVNLTVPHGEMHALIGPNGAGKTTLVSQLFGEILPDAGNVLLDGRDVTRLPTHARAVLGMARSFQITTLARDLTIYENVAIAVMAEDGHAFRFWGDLRQDRAIERRVMAALARVGLSDRTEEPVATLSHGEQRLLELAIALSGSPRLLLLDEPMAGLGTEESRRVTRFLADLKGSVAILLVEHDMDAVFALADRVTVLVRGEVIACGPPEAIRQDPVVREAYLGEDE